MSKKKINIFGNILVYASSQYFSQFIGFFTAIFIRRFLGTFYMGIWSLIKVITDYATFTHLGTTRTVFYKIPYFRGKGDIKEADNVQNIVFSYLVWTSILAGIAVAIYAVVSRATLPQGMFIGLLTVSVLILLRRIYTIYVMLLRANKDFTILSKSIVFDAIFNLCLVLVFVRPLGFHGLLVSVLLMPILNILFIRILVDYKVRFKYNFRKLIEYIRFGFPLFIAAILELLLKSVDKIMIARYIGLDALGIYSIALMAREYGVGVSKNFTIVLAPHMMTELGKKHDMETVRKYLILPTELMAIFMAILLGFICILAPLAIYFFLPDFSSGIPALKVLLIATFFFVASPQARHVLVAMEKRSYILYITIFAIVLNIGLNYYFLSKGYGIVGIAGATSISSFVVFLATLLCALNYIGNFRNSLFFCAKTIAPAIYSMGVIAMLDRVLVFSSSILETIVKAFVFAILFFPWVIWVNKRTDVFRVFLKMIVDKTKLAWYSLRMKSIFRKM